MITEVTRTGEAITLDEAKAELRINNRDFDTRVRRNLTRSLRWVEQLAQLTLATTVQWKMTLPDWPVEEVVKTGGPVWWYSVQSPIKLPHPPWKTTDSVKYFDLDDAEQTVTATNYNTRGSDTAPAELEFDEDFTFPSLRSRRDAVSITWTTGSATPDEIAIQAAIQRLHFLEFRDLDARDEAINLVRSLRNTVYGTS